MIREPFIAGILMLNSIAGLLVTSVSLIIGQISIGLALMSLVVFIGAMVASLISIARD
jgi:hypothetical protein